jgi:hypothetical protein
MNVVLMFEWYNAVNVPVISEKIEKTPQTLNLRGLKL